jgi:rhamnulokinase
MTDSDTTHVAVDVGSSSAAVVVGTVGSDRLDVREIHRFDSGLLDDPDRRVWKLDHLIGEIATGLERAATGRRLDSVGVDATAGGFGFLADGEPLRDPVREGSAVPGDVSAREAFFETGHRRLPSSYYYTYREQPDLVERADTLLLLPELIAHRLGAEPAGELTYAVSAGLGNIRTGTWATGLLEAFGLPTDLLAPMAPSGADLGGVDPRPGTGVDLDFDSDPRLRAVAGHDTSSAVAAIPFGEGDRAFLATGSWFIPGFEREAPVVTDAALDASAENLGGVADTVRFVRNLPGFSLLERFRRQWEETGGVFEYDALLEAARGAEPLRTLVATTDGRLRNAGDLREALADYCATTGQPVPRGEGAVTRCLLESLAAESAVVLDRLGAVVDASPDELRLVGGGARNPLLCRFVAGATGLPVVAGPVEATAVGNVLVQAGGAGSIDSIEAGRERVRRSFDFDRYEPGPEEWTDARERVAALL